MPPPKRWTRAQHDDAVADRHVGGRRAALDRRCRSPPPRRPVTAGLMRGRSAAGPTMSPSTAPASIEVSWPGSPTRISRASRPDGLGQPGHQGQRHHRGLVDDHDVVGAGGCRGRGGSGCGCRASSRAGGGASRPRARAAARGSPGRRRAAPPRRGPPPRAGRRPCRSGRRARPAAARAPAASACSSSSATMRATVVVLPVPGPPATTASRRSTAAAAACFCRGVGLLAGEQPGRSRRRGCPSARRCRRPPASASRSAATCCSSRQ